jgi:telomere length regulation protein
MVVGDWSTPWFVERTDPYLQNHVSVFIVYALNKIVETSNDKNNFYRSVLETSGISINILQGVTHRLQSTCSTESRLDGMRVAEALAKALGQELQFDELHDEQVPPHNVTKRQNYNDPDKEDKTDDHPKADDDSDWDENSALERYDVEDDEEDLRQIPRPFYLSECLDYLRANNENDVDCYSRHATVLQELPDLVRSRPADLADQAPELARSLLRLENKSGMKDFMEQVTHSISVLLVEEPLGVGSNMIEEFFVESTLLDRLTILNAVNTAAFELSGDKALLEKQEKQAELFYLEVGPRVSGRKAFVSETAVSSKNSTRRWGLGRRRSQQEKSVIHNRFQNIAPIWFYHFFSKFMDTKDDAAIWGGPNGARLLSSVFVTLTNIVECTGCYAPGVDVMAKDFLDFTWSFRDAEVSIVRSSVLYSVKGTLGLLREETLWRFLLNDSSDSLVRHLQIIQDQDPDSNCRHLAKAIAQTVANIVNEIGRLDPLLIEAR